MIKMMEFRLSSYLVSDISFSAIDKWKGKPECNEQMYANKFDNLEQRDKFLEKYHSRKSLKNKQFRIW